MGTFKSQEESSRHFDTSKAVRVRPCKPLAKGSLSSYQRKDLEQTADELVTIWEHLKYRVPVNKGHLFLSMRSVIPPTGPPKQG